jgi:hypothetical protein
LTQALATDGVADAADGPEARRQIAGEARVLAQEAKPLRRRRRLDRVNPVVDRGLVAVGTETIALLARLQLDIRRFTGPAVHTISNAAVLAENGGLAAVHRRHTGGDRFGYFRLVT